jgi:prepilin-type N-terminal cleavage/methylation domain-containing protein
MMVAGTRISRQACRRTGQAGVTLVELLVVMAILTIVGTMIIMGWWAGTQSMAFTVNSTEARDNGRTAIDRVTREIRDAQLPISASYIQACGFDQNTTPAIVRAGPTLLALFTSFNVQTALPSVNPHLVVYCLYPDGNLWRYADLNGNGQNDGASSWGISVSELTSSATTTLEQTARSWEGASLVCSNVVNPTVANGGNSSTDLFDYMSYTNSGTLQTQSPVLGDQNCSGIIAVQVHLLVDLNPGHSPVYSNLQTTAQLRNAH